MKQIYIIALLALAIVSISSCGKQGDPTIIDVAEEKGEKYNGRHVRWKGYILEDKKADETTLFGVVVEKGYLAVIKLKKPLEKPIAKDTEFWFEGKVDATMKGDMSAPQGGARMVFLEEGTVDFNSINTGNKAQKMQESKTSTESTPPQTNFPASPNTYDYRILWILDNSFNFLDADGNLTGRSDEISKKAERLLTDSGRFNLTSKDDLAAYGNYVGQELKLTNEQKVLMKITSHPAGKPLFCGELIANAKGAFELIPQKNLSARGFVTDVSFGWDEKEIEIAKRKQKQSGVFEISCP